MQRRRATDREVQRAYSVVSRMQGWIRNNRPYTVAELLEVREVRALIRLLDGAAKSRDGELIDEIIDLITRKAI